MNLVINRLILLLALWIAVFYETLVQIVSLWNHSKTYEHGWLIIPTVIWLIWDRRHYLRWHVNITSWQSVIALGLACLVWLLGKASAINLLTHIGAIMALQALIWFAFGNANSRLISFAIAFLVYCIPFGEELIPKLQLITADSTVFYLHLLQVPVYREGLYLTIPNGMFHVAEACSGIRFFISSTALGALLSYLFFNSWLKRGLFFLLSIALPIFANGIRAFAIVYIGYKTDMQHATGADHLIYGWLFFSMIIGLMLLIAYIGRDPQARSERAAYIELRHSHPNVERILISARLFPIFMLIPAFMLSATWYSNKIHLSTHTWPSHILIHQSTEQQMAQQLWGIEFKQAVIQQFLFDENVEMGFYYAQYLLSQKEAKLLSSNNRLYDPQIWQVHKRRQLSIDGLNATTLTLHSPHHPALHLVYWYCVNHYCSSNRLNIAFYSAFQRIIKGDAKASVYAISSKADFITTDLIHAPNKE